MESYPGDELLVEGLYGPVHQDFKIPVAKLFAGGTDKLGKVFGKYDNVAAFNLIKTVEAIC